jgi:2-dehydro-3-deoxygluconokinase
MHPCGAQWNVAADLAQLGKKTAFLSRLPENELGAWAIAQSAALGVDMSQVILTPNSRIGVIFVEFGAEPRGHGHLYDRVGSAASQMTAADYDWEQVLSGTRLAYTDGVFPGIGKGCLEAALSFARATKKVNGKLCFDVNYRQSLWKPEEAHRVYREILPYVDILVTNRDVSEGIFGYRGSDEELLRQWQTDFGCELVCMTARESMGSLHGAWSSMALNQGTLYRGRRMEYEVVDRFGTGDAFLAGMLKGYLDELPIDAALEFGNASCALAHTVEGDPLIVSPGEVAAFIKDGYDARTRR